MRQDFFGNMFCMWTSEAVVADETAKLLYTVRAGGNNHKPINDGINMTGIGIVIIHV